MLPERCTRELTGQERLPLTPARRALILRVTGPGARPDPSLYTMRRPDGAAPSSVGCVAVSALGETNF